MKKLLLIIITISYILFCGCSTVKKEVPNLPEENSLVDISPDEPVVTTADNVSANVPEVEYREFEITLEAEDSEISGGLVQAKARAGFSGTGYITGFDLSPNNAIKFSAQLPTNQHYNITISVASDERENNRLTINGETIGEFITAGSGEFEEISFKNVYIKNGLTNIGVIQVTGGIDFDRVRIQSSDEVSAIEYIVDSPLINENSTTKTKNTMQYLADNFGKRIISGQYATIGTNNELEAIYQATGRYPAMRMGDMMPYTTENAEQTEEIEQSIAWSNMGGMVSYVWHWLAPIGERSCYSDETNFDLSKAVTEIDVAQLTIAELEKLLADGKITEECFALISDIDLISKQLTILQANGVSVIWRPLHEASGGWFWWGAAGEDSYKWLWELLYERQTEFHGLNNLIWVWNAQMESWYVGDELCDIISADIYVDTGSLNSQVNTFLQLKRISASKLIALSECANPPSPDLMLRDNSAWSFFGVWSGDYVVDELGSFSEKYISRQQLINIYSHESIVTLEKLPDMRTYKKNG